MLQNTTPPPSPIKETTLATKAKQPVNCNTKMTCIYNKSFDACLLKNHFYWGAQRMADYFILLGQ